MSFLKHNQLWTLFLSLSLLSISCGDSEEEQPEPLRITVFDVAPTALYENSSNRYTVSVATVNHSEELTVYFKAEDPTGKVIRELSFPSQNGVSNGVNIELPESYDMLGFFPMVGELRFIASTSSTYSTADGVVDTTFSTLLADLPLLKGIPTPVRDVSKLNPVGDELDVLTISGASSGDSVLVNNDDGGIGAANFTDVFLYKSDGTLVGLDTTLSDGRDTGFEIADAGDYNLIVVFSPERSTLDEPNQYSATWK